MNTNTIIGTGNIEKMLKLIRIINKTKKVSKTNLKYLANNTNLDFSIIEKYLKKDNQWKKYKVNGYNYYTKQDNKGLCYINDIYNKNKEKIIYFYIRTTEDRQHIWSFSY